MSIELESIIKKHIIYNEPMSVETYWNLCLAHPEYGYYITRDPLGEKGDFTTAPEISQLFGEMIGVWVGEQWHRLGSPSKFHLVECGPGRGTLMADLLRIGKIIPDFIEAANIHLIETSPILRQKQREVLRGYNVLWHEDFETIPDDAPLIVIGNEFLDALPIQQFVFKDNQWFEKVIGIEGNNFIWGLGPAPVPLPIQGKDGIFEISLAREDFIKNISISIKDQGGAAIMVDYGHDISGFGDTLQAVKSHQFADVLKDCGDADLTSHVDFGRLKDIAVSEGLAVRVMGQGDFLKRLGIEQRAAQLSQKSDTIEGGLRRLVDDDKMGTLFRVMEILR